MRKTSGRESAQTRIGPHGVVSTYDDVHGTDPHGVGSPHETYGPYDPVHGLGKGGLNEFGERIGAQGLSGVTSAYGAHAPSLADEILSAREAAARKAAGHGVSPGPAPGTYVDNATGTLVNGSGPDYAFNHASGHAVPYTGADLFSASGSAVEGVRSSVLGEAMAANEGAAAAAHSKDAQDVLHARSAHSTRVREMQKEAAQGNGLAEDMLRSMAGEGDREAENALQDLRYTKENGPNAEGGIVMRSGVPNGGANLSGHLGLGESHGGLGVHATSRNLSSGQHLSTTEASAALAATGFGAGGVDAYGVDTNGMRFTGVDSRGNVTMAMGITESGVPIDGSGNVVHNGTMHRADDMAAQKRAMESARSAAPGAGLASSIAMEALSNAGEISALENRLAAGASLATLGGAESTQIVEDIKKDAVERALRTHEIGADASDEKIRQIEESALDAAYLSGSAPLASSVLTQIENDAVSEAQKNGLITSATPVSEINKIREGAVRNAIETGRVSASQIDALSREPLTNEIVKEAVHNAVVRDLPVGELAQGVEPAVYKDAIERTLESPTVKTAVQNAIEQSALAGKIDTAAIGSAVAGVLSSEMGGRIGAAVANSLSESVQSHVNDAIAEHSLNDVKGSLNEAQRTASAVSNFARAAAAKTTDPAILSQLETVAAHANEFGAKSGALAESVETARSVAGVAQPSSSDAIVMKPAGAVDPALQSAISAQEAFARTTQGGHFSSALDQAEKAAHAAAAEELRLRTERARDIAHIAEIEHQSDLQARELSAQSEDLSRQAQELRNAAAREATAIAEGHAGETATRAHVEATHEAAARAEEMARMRHFEALENAEKARLATHEAAVEQGRAEGFASAMSAEQSAAMLEEKLQHEEAKEFERRSIEMEEEEKAVQEVRNRQRAAEFEKEARDLAARNAHDEVAAYNAAFVQAIDEKRSMEEAVMIAEHAQKEKAIENEKKNIDFNFKVASQIANEGFSQAQELNKFRHTVANDALIEKRLEEAAAVKKDALIMNGVKPEVAERMALESLREEAMALNREKHETLENITVAQTQMDASLNQTLAEMEAQLSGQAELANRDAGEAVARQMVHDAVAGHEMAVDAARQKSGQAAVEHANGMAVATKAVNHAALAASQVEDKDVANQIYQAAIANHSNNLDSLKNERKNFAVETMIPSMSPNDIVKNSLVENEVEKHVQAIDAMSDNEITERAREKEIANLMDAGYTKESAGVIADAKHGIAKDELIMNAARAVAAESSAVRPKKPLGPRIDPYSKAALAGKISSAGNISMAEATGIIEKKQQAQHNELLDKIEKYKLGTLDAEDEQKAQKESLKNEVDLVSELASAKMGVNEAFKEAEIARTENVVDGGKIEESLVGAGLSRSDAEEVRRDVENHSERMLNSKLTESLARSNDPKAGMQAAVLSERNRRADDLRKVEEMKAANATASQIKNELEKRNDSLGNSDARRTRSQIENEAEIASNLAANEIAGLQEIANGLQKNAEILEGATNKARLSNEPKAEVDELARAAQEAAQIAQAAQNNITERAKQMIGENLAAGVKKAAIGRGVDELKHAVGDVTTLLELRNPEAARDLHARGDLPILNSIPVVADPRLPLELAKKVESISKGPLSTSRHETNFEDLENEKNRKIKETLQNEELNQIEKENEIRLSQQKFEEGVALNRIILDEQNTLAKMKQEALQIDNTSMLLNVIKDGESKAIDNIESQRAIDMLKEKNLLDFEDFKKHQEIRKVLEDAQREAGRTLSPTEQIAALAEHDRQIEARNQMNRLAEIRESAEGALGSARTLSELADIAASNLSTEERAALDNYAKELKRLEAEQIQRNEIVEEPMTDYERNLLSLRQEREKAIAEIEASKLSEELKTQRLRDIERDFSREEAVAGKKLSEEEMKKAEHNRMKVMSKYAMDPIAVTPEEDKILQGAIKNMAAKFQIGGPAALSTVEQTLFKKFNAERQLGNEAQNHPDPELEKIVQKALENNILPFNHAALTEEQLIQEKSGIMAEINAHDTEKLNQYRAELAKRELEYETAFAEKTMQMLPGITPGELGALKMKAMEKGLTRENAIEILAANTEARKAAAEQLAIEAQMLLEEKEARNLIDMSLKDKLNEKREKLLEQIQAIEKNIKNLKQKEKEFKAVNEFTEKIKPLRFEDLKILQKIPDDQTQVELENAKMKLPLKTFVGVKPHGVSEELAVNANGERAEELANAITAENVQSSLNTIQNDTGYYQIPPNAKAMQIEDGLAVFPAAAREEMMKEGKDVSSLQEKVVTGGEGIDLPFGMSYYVAPVDHMTLQLPSPINGSPPAVLAGKKGSLDISKAIGLQMKKAKVDLIPTDIFKKNVRAKLKRPVKQPLSRETGKEALEREGLRKEDAVKVRRLENRDGITAVLDPPIGVQQVVDGRSPLIFGRGKVKSKDQGQEGIGTVVDEIEKEAEPSLNTLQQGSAKRSGEDRIIQMGLELEGGERVISEQNAFDAKSNDLKRRLVEEMREELAEEKAGENVSVSGGKTKKTKNDEAKKKARLDQERAHERLEMKKEEAREAERQLGERNEELTRLQEMGMNKNAEQVANAIARNEAMQAQSEAAANMFSAQQEHRQAGQFEHKKSRFGKAHVKDFAQRFKETSAGGRCGRGNDRVELNCVLHENQEQIARALGMNVHEFAGLFKSLPESTKDVLLRYKNEHENAEFQQEYREELKNIKNVFGSNADSFVQLMGGILEVVHNRSSEISLKKSGGNRFGITRSNTVRKIVGNSIKTLDKRRPMRRKKPRMRTIRRIVVKKLPAYENKTSANREVLVNPPAGTKITGAGIKNNPDGSARVGLRVEQRW